MIVIRPTARPCVAALLLMLAPPVAGQAQVTFVSNGQAFNDMVGRGVVLADFNGDAALDAFVVNESGPTSQDCRVYFGDGRGQFTDSGQRLTASSPARRPVVHDIDGNGTKDVLVGRAAWMNDGRGRFGPGDSPLVDSDGAMVWQCRLADLNGDGVTDLAAIVTVANMESRVRVYLGDHTRRFKEAGETPLPGIAASVELGDLNGDGAIDAVVSGWRNAAADGCPNRVLLNDGKGRFTDAAQPLDEEMRHSHGLALGDVDRDGDLDVVLVTQGTPSARLYLNDGKGRFTAGRTLGTSSVEKVGLADLNGDGSLDIFLACIGPDEVWLNDGRGTFEDSRLRLGKDWSWELAVGDFNGDGRPDVFVVNLGVDRTAPPENMMRSRPAEVWLNSGRRTTPLVGEPAAGGDVTVTFLAKSAGGLVPRVVSDVTGWGEHIDGTFDFTAGTMTRVGKSDWYSLQTTVAPRARIEYQIAYGRTDYRLDPHNPRRSAGPAFGGAAASEFVTPGYVPPQEFEGSRSSPPGAVTEGALEGPCKVMVYRPPGYSSTGDYPVAVFLDLRTDPMSRVLDWLIARRDIPPIVAAFVGPRSYGHESCLGAPMAEFVTGRLLAWLRSRHGVAGSADSHAIIAISYSAKDALEIALRNPGAFRRLGLLIPGRRINRADITTIPGHRAARLRVAILAGQYDHANRPTARGLRQALTDAGHLVNYTEVPEGHSASTWRNHLRGVLVNLFGIPSGPAAAER